MDSDLPRAIDVFKSSPALTCLGSASKEPYQLWEPGADPVHVPSEQSSISIPYDTRSASNGGFCDLFLGILRPRGLVLAMKRPRFPVLEVNAKVVAIKRFRKEAKIWTKLSHVNVLPFYGIIEVLEETYLVSPWVAHGDLSRFAADYIKYLELPAGDRPQHEKHKVYSAYREFDIVIGISSGLAHLHAQNIVHGDVKALNVLLDSNINPLLCDFGMAKSLDSNSVSSVQNKGGTWRWMSPELIMGNSTRKSTESDMYAFSMTIVEILTGSNPFPHLGNFAVCQKVTCGARPELPPITREGQDFEKLWNTAKACWAQDPEKRLSADAVVETLIGGGIDGAHSRP